MGATQIVIRAPKRVTDRNVSAMMNVLPSTGSKAAALKIDLLVWWKSASTRMPIHARAARRLLGIQATGVASGSVFSDACRIRGNLRSGLDKGRLRILTMLNRALLTASFRRET